MARRKPRDFAEQLKLRAGRGADPIGGAELDPGEKIACPGDGEKSCGQSQAASRAAKERVAAPNKLAISPKNRSGRSESERREAIAPTNRLSVRYAGRLARWAKERVTSGVAFAVPPALMVPGYEALNDNPYRQGGSGSNGIGRQSSKTAVSALPPDIADASTHSLARCVFITAAV